MAAVLIIAGLLSVAAAVQPAGWMKGERADPSIPLKLTIGVKQNAAGKATLLDNFWRISDPKSPSFGQHMSKSEVDALTAPSASTISAISSWLTTAGITYAFTTSQGACGMTPPLSLQRVYNCVLVGTALVQFRSASRLNFLIAGT